MKVFYFSRSYTPHDYRFLAAISEAGHTAAYLRLEPEARQSEDRPVPPGVQQILWEGAGAAFRWTDIPRLVPALRRILHDSQPDVVHAGPIQTCAYLSALAGFHPLLAMSWGYDLVQDAARSRWMEWVTRYTLQRCDWFISDAHVTRARAIAYGVDAARTTVFPWGVNLERFAPAPASNARKDGFNLFCNRTWEPLYGVDVLARAFGRLAPQHPGLSLALLGSGSQAAALRQIFLGAGVLDRVSFGGNVPQRDLPGWYHQADLYISPSHVDGSSVSLMEALACGLPVLVSDIPGNREWVTEGENGWLFRDGDAEDLAAKILHACEERGSLAEMGRRSRAIAEARADWKKNAAALLQTYEEVTALREKR